MIVYGTSPQRDAKGVSRRDEPGVVVGEQVGAPVPGAGLVAGAGGACDATTAAVRALGWPGVALPELTLLGCRLTPVVVPDVEAHLARTASGHGPQRDGDTLAIWEWPQAVGSAPAPALRLAGTLFRVRRGWRRALSDASRWRAFGAAAVLAPAPVAGDDLLRWECSLHGVGLVAVDQPGDARRRPGEDAHRQPGEAMNQLGEEVVRAEPGRRAAARRRTADRWVEETLYAHALAAGVYP